MGCRPSKNAKGKVRDLKFKNKISKKNWINFDLTPISVEENRYSGFSDGISTCDVKSKRIGDTRNKKIVFSKFSTTSKTYHNLDSKVATITLRLSTDGSTLQVEKVEIEIDIPIERDDKMSPTSNYLKRSESAPELSKIPLDCFSKRSEKILKSELPRLTASSKRPDAFLRGKHLVVTVHQEPLDKENNIRNENRGNNTLDISIDKNTYLTDNSEDSISINYGQENVKEIMNSFNPECNVRPEASVEDSLLDKQSLLSSSLSSSSEFSLCDNHALIQKDDRIGHFYCTKNTPSSEFSLTGQNVLIHKENGIWHPTSDSNTITNQTDNIPLINKSHIQLSDNNCNQQSCCSENRNDKGFHNLKNGLKVSDRTYLRDKFINKPNHECISSSQSLHLRNNILLKNPFKGDERNFNLTKITHTVHDKMDCINCNGRKCNKHTRKHTIQPADSRRSAEIKIEKSHLKNCGDTLCQKLPPLASFSDDFQNAFENDKLVDPEDVR